MTISVLESTKDKLDGFTRNHGLKKNFVIEQALLWYMSARQELPDEAFLPTRLVLQDDAFDRLVERISESPAPTDALRDLMSARER